jgi:hypothetical protein
MFWESLFWTGVVVLVTLSIHLLAVRAVQRYGAITVLGVSLMFVGSKLGREFIADTFGLVLE